MRTNLISNPSTFGKTTTGWDTVGSVNLGVSTEYAYFGDSSFIVQSRTEGSTPSDPGEGLIVNSGIAIVPNQFYNTSVYAFVPLHTDNAYPTALVLKVYWKDAAGASAGEDVSEVVTVHPRDDWSDNRISLVRQAPANAVEAFVSVETVYSGEHGREFLVDGFLMEVGEYVGEFFNNRTQAQETTLVNHSLTKVPFPHIEGMELNADIAIGNLVLNTIDEDGTIWVCTDIEGWWEPAAPETPNITRGTEDGSYDITGRYAAREIVLKGVFLPQEKAYTAKAREKLITSIDLVRKGAWLKTNEEPTKAARVRLVGRPSIQNTTPRGRTEFSIPLRAADPVKYEWNDNDIEGITRFALTAQVGQSLIENTGNATVATLITVNGPLGAGSTIDAYSKVRDETITTAFELREAGPIATLTAISAVNNIVTMKTDYISGLIPGDIVSFSGVDADYIPSSKTATVLAVSDVDPYLFSYSHNIADFDERTLALASVNLVSPDVMHIDTYNQTVTLNGDTTGQRSRLAPLIDWIKLSPGDTIITLMDEPRVYKVLAKVYNSSTGIATLTLDRAHYMSAGDYVTVSLPEEAVISTKQIKDVDGERTAVLTTTAPHGFAVGDKIDVTITATSDVAYKSVDVSGDAPVVTLRTQAAHGISPTDDIIVALPVTATVSAKSVTSGVVTIITGSAEHGFSIGDYIDISFPTQAYVTRKAVKDDFVTLTAVSHGFSTNDSITVALPATTDVIGKVITPTTVTLESDAAHGYSIGDTVTVALPEDATVARFEFAGSAGGYVATVTTEAAHGYDVGDRVTGTVTIGGTTTTYTSRYVESVDVLNKKFTFIDYTSATAVNDGVATGTFKDNTNDEINGTKVITAIPAPTTFSYAR